MTRVLLADDQGLVRAGFKALLSAQPDIDVVGEAADGAEAVDLAETCLLYTSPNPRDLSTSRMPSSA